MGDFTILTGHLSAEKVLLVKSASLDGENLSFESLRVRNILDGQFGENARVGYCHASDSHRFRPLVDNALQSGTRIHI